MSIDLESASQSILIDWASTGSSPTDELEKNLVPNSTAPSASLNR